MSRLVSSYLKKLAALHGIDFADDLDHSRLFDIHRWSDNPEVTAAVDLIYPDLVRLMAGHHKDSVKKHLRVVMLNLYAAWLENSCMYVAYHRNRNAYRPRSRYNALKIGITTVDVIDALASLGYVETHKGFRSRERHTSRISRMRGTQSVIDLIQACRIAPQMAGLFAKAECIVLRRRTAKSDDEKLGRVEVEYRDTPETRRMRVVLARYNDLIAASDIRLTPADDVPEGQPPAVNLDRKFTRRIFNGSFEQGGRFYGGWWVNFPSDWRSQITINGMRTAELDYRALHAVMLYAQRGINYPAMGRGDPYDLPAYRAYPWARKLQKKAFHIAVNAGSRSAAAKALGKSFPNGDAEGQAIRTALGGRLSGVLDDLADFHALIRDAFYSDVGVKLQFLESQMAEHTIDDMTGRGVPVLCVHDSFLIQRDRVMELGVLMAQAYGRIVRDAYGLDLPEEDLGIGLKANDPLWAGNIGLVVNSLLPVLSARNIRFNPDQY